MEMSSVSNSTESFDSDSSSLTQYLSEEVLSIVGSMMILYLFPNLKIIFRTAAINLLLSLFQIFQRGLHLFFQVRKGYRCGVITPKNMVHLTRDYVLFRMRKWAIHNLQCGSLSTHGRIHSLTYYVGHQRYIIRFPLSRHLRSIVRVTHVQEDVTTQFLEYYGPSRNFHGVPTTPHLLGWPGGITIHYRSGNEIFYSSFEPIPPERS
jgi:hypothetical protein